MRLPEIRQQIDILDEQILKLLNARAELVHEVGELKRTEGLEIYAPEREEQVYRSLVERNAKIGGRLPDPAVRAVYREIMSASLALEKDLRIAYLGPEATFTHQAARSKFGASVKYASEASIADVFSSVVRGRADYGVVPVENSWEGAVNHTLDMFIDSEARICAQILLKIEHQLLSRGKREGICGRGGKAGGRAVWVVGARFRDSGLPGEHYAFSSDRTEAVPCDRERSHSPHVQCAARTGRAVSGTRAFRPEPD